MLSDTLFHCSPNILYWAAVRRARWLVNKITPDPECIKVILSEGSPMQRSIILLQVNIV